LDGKESFSSATLCEGGGLGGRGSTGWEGRSTRWEGRIQDRKCGKEGSLGGREEHWKLGRVVLDGGVRDKEGGALDGRGKHWILGGAALD
jgi:hypothetical protein